RVHFRVEHMSAEHHQHHHAPLVHALPQPVLGRVQEAELPLPIAQHVRLQVGELADLPNGEELLDRMGRAHRHCSALSSRSINAVTAWRGDFPWNSTSVTSCAMGSSILWRSPSVKAG